MNRSLELLKKAVSLTQVLMAIAMPIFLCVVGGLWLTNRFSWPGWVMAVFVLLGVASALWNFWKWLRPFLKKGKKDDPPAAFNDHF